VNIDDLRPGMVLSKSVVAPNGRFLLGEGTHLEDKHIRALKTWGAVNADVDGVSRQEAESEADGVIDPLLLKKAEELLLPRFALNDVEDPVVQELLRLAVLRDAKKAAAGGGFVGSALHNTDTGSEGQIETDDKALEKLEVRAHDLVRGEVKLVSFPQIYFKIVEVLESPLSTANHVAEVVGKDTSLSARLLRVVNSPIYGFPSTIDSISKAVTIIGGNELTTLAMGISVIDCFKDIPTGTLDVKSFWMHSIAVGIISGILAGKQTGVSEERLFVAGVLHDIGKLIMIKHYPAHSVQVMKEAGERACSTQQLEKEIFGFHHARVGSLLLEEWKIPPVLKSIVNYHHKPLCAEDPVEPCIVHVADFTATALGFGSSGTMRAPTLDAEALQILSLSSDELVQVASLAERQFNEVVHAFLGEDC
jgi:putative nucleotidyltransferase with HDIG domain